jgi:NAD(P) transhydrogenase subunit alpha
MIDIANALLAAETAEAGPAVEALSLPWMAAVTIFVLAMLYGLEIITKIPPTLHTPLMSGSNAISGITLVGAILAAGAGHGAFAAILGFLAVIMATINVVGGFLVTHRMLEMFRRKD